MPQSIISQFSRAYNSPIEVNRQVATATERDAINSSVRWEGMLVYVVADNVTYELAGGISNGDWQVLGGLQDAPSDGQIYGRKNGAWSIISNAPTGDDGTTGLILKGSSSGTYTTSTQEWEWSKFGNQVYFSLRVTGVDGTSPTGEFQIDLSTTTIPGIASIYSLFNVVTNNFPINFYSILSYPFNGNTLRIFIQSSLDGSNQELINNVDFAGLTTIIINGSYITNE